MEEQNDRRISQLQGDRRTNNRYNNPPSVSVSNQTAGYSIRSNER